MDKYIYDEKNGLWYELQGDCYLPCLKLPEERTACVGVWGQRHLKFLKQHHKVRYYNLLTNGMLNDYLADIDLQAEKMFAHLNVLAIAVSCVKFGILYSTSTCVIPFSAM